MFTRKMMHINLQLVFVGTNTAFYSGMLTPIMVLQLKQQEPDGTKQEVKAL
jgi:hypothetical protein